MAMIASLATAVGGLSPSWSFASTTTITDDGTPWYTISAPFLTTITTNVSGTVETIIATKVSISIGTDSPSAIPPVVSASSLTILGTASIYATMDTARVHEVRRVKARSSSTSTKELTTHTQSSTIDDSDVLPTTSSIADQGDSTTSSPTSTVAVITATSSTTTKPRTSIYYFTSGTSNAPSTSTSVSSFESTTTFGMGTVMPSDTAYSTSTCDYDETSTSILTMSIPTFVTPISWTTTDPQSTSHESTTLTTRTLTLSPFTTVPLASTCHDVYNPTWQWGHGTEPTHPPVGDVEPPRPHPTLPFEHPPALRRAQWIAVLE
ncbi:hypothetical protein EV127DRAFT_474510 [Xylaria flabelliformis]|nr:hypothetical protein EV127DRAFT_474510 [Xylaria flabelliformis]